jgi:hypothetical protein
MSLYAAAEKGGTAFLRYCTKRGHLNSCQVVEEYGRRVSKAEYTVDGTTALLTMIDKVVLSFSYEPI